MTHTKETEHANRAPEPEFTSIEICAGAGGQAVGLHQAGFGHLALVEIDRHAVETLELNINDHEVWTWERAHCDVLLADVKDFNPHKDLTKGADLLKGRDLDLLAGGVPCPPSRTRESSSARMTSETSSPACLISSRQ
ncbi:DNA (cytosine-5)-methyltransferase 1 [Streptomyces sp. DconLS]|nr:DNA (cytosine-5)-methyltransferase 1 [Streptomyces sp. DconLS]